MPESNIAIVQAGSFVFDTPRTLEKLEKLTAEAAQLGAQLVLFPEAFIGGYPKGLDFGVVLGKRSDAGRDEFKRYFNSSIEADGPESKRIGAIARENRVHLVVGVVEREGGTLYCSVFFYSPDGEFLTKHRKLIPTALERVNDKLQLWGQGDGSTMPVLSTSVGKIGAAICWENYMPLYRVALYNKGIELYLAPTVDDRDAWLPTMTTIALEGRCFVISAAQFLTAAHFPDDHPTHTGNKPDTVLIRGGSCVVGPLGEVLVKPDFTKETIHLVKVDTDVIVRGKFDLDAVGHYNRPDIFQLTVDERKKPSVKTIQE